MKLILIFLALLLNGCAIYICDCPPKEIPKKIQGELGQKQYFYKLNLPEFSPIPFNGYEFDSTYRWINPDIIRRQD